MSTLAQKVKAAASVVGIALTLNSSDDDGAVHRAVRALDTDSRNRIERQLKTSGNARAAAKVHRMVQSPSNKPSATSSNYVEPRSRKKPSGNKGNYVNMKPKFRGQLIVCPGCNYQLVAPDEVPCLFCRRSGT